MMQKKHFYLTATLVWLALIWYISSLPASHFPTLKTWTYAFVHFFEYFILTFLVYKTWFHHGFTALVSSVSALGGLLLLAALDEWHQRWIWGRIPSWEDFLFDALGIGLATLGILLLRFLSLKKLFFFSRVDR